MVENYMYRNVKKSVNYLYRNVKKSVIFQRKWPKTTKTCRNCQKIKSMINDQNYQNIQILHTVCKLHNVAYLCIESILMGNIQYDVKIYLIQC